MQAPDSVFSHVTRLALLALIAATFGACATKQEVALVNDPSVSGRESALPWNQQEKWEGQGQFGSMADRFNQSGSGSRR
jgi:hypothetical protein